MLPGALSVDACAAAFVAVFDGEPLDAAVCAALPELTLEEAYRVQDRVADLRAERGDGRVLGR